MVVKVALIIMGENSMVYGLGLSDLPITYIQVPSSLWIHSLSGGLWLSHSFLERYLACQIEVGEDNDKCVRSLAHDGVFSVGDLRRRIDDHILPSVDTKMIWDKSLPRKVNIFMWRLKLDRLPHRLNLSSRGIDILDISCPSCIAFPLFDSNAHWIDWLDSLPVSREKKHCLLVIIAASL
uniref:RNA-directed DNA polymerase, eukaryota n=1 Tax=Tanacetum cinerariifolium TaxID=118510 RepID=A0A6L2MGI1_TANCI|nr:RNA-directed DNA polymerase, eukaryota [Tanacetum cinerariifolium]